MTSSSTFFFLFLLLLCISLYSTSFSSYFSLPFPSSTHPTPLFPPWPLLLFGTSTVSFLHSLILLLSPPQLSLMWHASGFLKTGALRTAAKLNIADVIEEERRKKKGGKGTTGREITMEEGVRIGLIANRTRSGKWQLERLMIALESIGVFVQVSGGRVNRDKGSRNQIDLDGVREEEEEEEEENESCWLNTAMSDYLLTNHPSSMNSLLLMMGEEQYISYSRLDHSIRSSGTSSSFSLVYGSDFWNYLNSHSYSQKVFYSALTSLSFLTDASIAIDWPYWNQVNSVVDMGGGSGGLIEAILSQHSHIHGILFEQTNIINNYAAKHWIYSQYSNRTTLISGDLFDSSSFPPHADTYILKQVLHKFSDSNAIQILTNLHSIMCCSSTRLLIIDRLLKSHSSFISSHGTAFVDLLMLANFGDAGERYDVDLIRILNKSGFELKEIRETRSDFYIIEAKPVISKEEEKKRKKEKERKEREEREQEARGGAEGEQEGGGGWEKKKSKWKQVQKEKELQQQVREEQQEKQLRLQQEQQKQSQQNQNQVENKHNVLHLDHVDVIDSKSIPLYVSSNSIPSFHNSNQHQTLDSMKQSSNKINSPISHSSSSDTAIKNSKTSASISGENSQSSIGRKAGLRVGTESENKIGRENGIADKEQEKEKVEL